MAGWAAVNRSILVRVQTPEFVGGVCRQCVADVMRRNVGAMIFRVSTGSPAIGTISGVPSFLILRVEALRRVFPERSGPACL